MALVSAMTRDRTIPALLLALSTAAFAWHTFRRPLTSSEQLAALLAFAPLFSLYLLLAIPALIARLRRLFGGRRTGVFLAAAGLLAAYALYALSVGRWRWPEVGACALYVAFPAAVLTAAPPPREGLTLQDGLALAGLWLPIEFEWVALAKLPVEDGIAFGKLLGLVWGLWLFLVVRRVDGVGYRFDLGMEDLRQAGVHFALFGVFFAIPIAVPTRFAIPSPPTQPLFDIAATLLAIAVLVALPEELLFRGLLQNLLARRWRRPQLAWACASLLFGLAHANDPHHPAGLYVVLATIAGGFYGLTFMKTGKVTAAAVTHWLVDSYWYLFFHQAAPTAG
jgi:membrane protease YdiL (CAAX protease family)